MRTYSVRERLRIADLARPIHNTDDRYTLERVAMWLDDHGHLDEILRTLSPRKGALLQMRLFEGRDWFAEQLTDELDESLTEDDE